MRIEFTKKTIRALEKRLIRAKKVGNTKQIEKIVVILMLAKNIGLSAIAGIFGITERTIYIWRNEFLCNGMNFFDIRKYRGRRSRLSEKQKQELKQMIISGPEKSGFSIGIWTSAMVKELIEKKYKVSYHVRYVPELLKSLGLSYQKAKFTPDKDRSEEKKVWREETWPSLLAQAELEDTVILFEDEASFAMWGSLSYTWGLKGQQPLIPTCGKRKNLKVFGAIDYRSGRFVFQTFDGKINSQRYICFLKKLLERFSSKIILVHDGAPYHRSKTVQSFLNKQQRMEAIALPSYAPDYNIIEYLWKKVKKHTHNKYYPTFSSLRKCVHSALRFFQRHTSEVTKLCRSYVDMLFHGIS